LYLETFLIESERGIPLLKYLLTRCTFGRKVHVLATIQAMSTKTAGTEEYSHDAKEKNFWPLTESMPAWTGEKNGWIYLAATITSNGQKREAGSAVHGIRVLTENESRLRLFHLRACIHSARDKITWAGLLAMLSLRSVSALSSFREDDMGQHVLPMQQISPWPCLVPKMAWPTWNSTGHVAL
jgi:hypothetical protein